MNVTCDIIRDLLPLYAEDMVSDDSKQLVDEHLCGCDACTRYLGEMKKQPPVPVEMEPESLSKVKKMIVRRRVLSVLASVLTLLTLASFVITYLFAPFQLTKEQALDDFYVQEDGGVVIDYSSGVHGRGFSGINENWFITQYSNRYDIWKGENRKSIEEQYGADGIITEEERLRYENIDIVYGSWQSADGNIQSDASIPEREDAMLMTGGGEWNWWYADPTGLGNDVLLHDAGKEFPGLDERIAFSPVYPIIFFSGAVMVCILLVLRRIVKKAWVKELMNICLILSASTVFSTFFVSSGRIFTSSVGIISQYWGWMIGINTVFLTQTIFFWRQLYLLNRQDKGD